ncbi:MAG: hypothetical protein RL140_402 [Actinomycetota bacterium]|jgi:4-hydroxybenzoate polyprenyltransferase
MKTAKVWAKQLRLHQWVKNLLVVVPAFAAFDPLQPIQLRNLFLAFIAFGFVASAVYVLNDLTDLTSDREHPKKKNRPVAAGLVTVPVARVVSIALLVAGVAIAHFVNLSFVVTLLCYLALTFAYSFWLKRAVIVDALVLAALYTLRIVAGGFAVGVQVSFWLAAFSSFLFFSLAWVKRHAELTMWKDAGLSPVGRGYKLTDQPLVMTFGISSALVAVAVFALYLDSKEVVNMYASPELAWLAIPLLTYLVARIWFKTVRGEMNQDPVLFVLRDAASLVTLILIAILVAISHIGFPI